MKKVFAGLFIMMMGLFFVACSGGADLKGLIEKAKAEGANWTEDQWKDAYKDAMKAMKPMLKESAELQKKAQEAKDETEQMKYVSEAMELMEKYKDVTEQMGEFQQIAESNPVAKKVLEDKAFEEEVKKELGLEELGL